MHAFYLGTVGGRCKDGDRKVALFGLVMELHLVHPADDLGMLCSVVNSPCATELHVDAY